MSTNKKTIRRSPWPGSVTHPLGNPIQPSVVYTAQTPSALDDLYEGRVAGYSYAREGHPNASVLAQKIDQMEGISGGIIT
ncbi:MAG: cystathionine gamma-synthase, partial [Pseudoruegeria sp.]